MDKCEWCPKVWLIGSETPTCGVREDASDHPGPFRQLWRALTGYYECPNDGRLPCNRFNEWQRSKDGTEE